MIRKNAALAFIVKNMIYCIASLKPVSQLSFTSSKSTIETLEKIVKQIKVNNENTRITSLQISLVLVI